MVGRRDESNRVREREDENVVCMYPSYLEMEGEIKKINRRDRGEQETVATWRK